MRTISIVILDSSSSMRSIEEQAISGYNEALDSIEESFHDGDSVFVTHFSHEVQFTVVDGKKGELPRLERLPLLGSTALYDAVGSTLKKVDELIVPDSDTRYLVTIVTDGMENASRSFSGETVAELIRSRNESGQWTVWYIGSNQNLEEIAKNLNINRGNMVTFDSTVEGTLAANAVLRGARSSYYSSSLMSQANTFSAGDEIAHANDIVDKTSTKVESNTSK